MQRSHIGRRYHAPGKRENIRRAKEKILTLEGAGLNGRAVECPLDIYGVDIVVFFLESLLSAESFQEAVHHCYGSFAGFLYGVFQYGN